MKLTFRFLGRLAEDLADVETPSSFDEGMKVSALRRRLTEVAPDSAERLETCMVAVNADYVGEDHVLNDGDEVAFLPPVSGG